MKVILDVHKLENAENAHEYLKGALNFPEYYGNNLDALYDCLNELTDVDIVFSNSENAGEYFKKILRVFKAACEENKGLQSSSENLRE